MTLLIENSYSRNNVLSALTGISQTGGIHNQGELYVLVNLATECAPLQLTDTGAPDAHKSR
jgi:hypothetical protein